jgi:hypothetical protein
MKKITFVIFTLLASTLVFIACQKSNSSPSSDSATTAEQINTSANADAEATTSYNDVAANVLGVNSDAGLGNGIGVFLQSNTSASNTSDFIHGTDSTHCYIVTISPDTVGVFPKTITIDFGTGCTGIDGHTRRGKIITVYTGRMVKPGSTATTTFDGFYIDSNKIEGTHIIQNNSTARTTIFTVNVQNGKITKPNGDYNAVNFTRTWTQTEGSGTPGYPLDNVYSITGNASGTVSKNDTTVQWTANITTPLTRKFTCRWIVAGQTTITRNNLSGVLDYGDGTCDNQATLTVGSKVYNITLK